MIVLHTTITLRLLQSRSLLLLGDATYGDGDGGSDATIEQWESQSYFIIYEKS